MPAYKLYTDYDRLFWYFYQQAQGIHWDLRIASNVVMQPSQSLKILLDMLREDLRTKLNSSIGGMPNTGDAVDDSIGHAIETLREGLLDKFELVAKADYEAQVALLENMRAQLKDLEERLAALEQAQAS